MISKTVEYRVWVSIKQRCFPSENVFSYEEGVPMDSRWENSFDEFLKSVGKKPEGKYYLTRKYKDVGFVPGNCYWSKELPVPQRESTIILKYNNRKMSLKDWSKETGINYTTLLHRYHSGWEIEDILTTPPEKGNSKLRHYQKVNDVLNFKDV